jgi:4-hydroxy-2-oxoheptanedioate aldolase
MMTDSNAGPYAIRDRWAAGQVTLGGWCAIGNSFSAELMARSGFDWICIDQQHGMVSPDALLPMVQALSITGTPAFVRVAWNDPAVIMRALDTGAQGVIVPLVNTAADAELAVDAARYPPRGGRSWGPARPLHEIAGYTPEIGDRRTIVTVQIETVEAVENLDAILDVPGVDGVFVGPSDLALTAGWMPTLTPTVDEHRAMILRILEVAHAHDVVAGIYCGGPAMAVEWRDAGFDMLAVTSDSIILKSGAIAALKQVRPAGDDTAATAY